MKAPDDPALQFSRFLDHVFATYRGRGIESTGKRLGAMRIWLSSAGRTRAFAAIRALERDAGGASEGEIADSLWMSKQSYQKLKRWVRDLPPDETPPLKAFISYRWESGEHVAWVRQLATDLREAGIDAILDQWEVHLGESFTDYMQRHIAEADVVLFVITPGAVADAEAPNGQGGALKFEVQMMNARRMADGLRIIGIYRAGDRPPLYLRDHRYADFRDDSGYSASLKGLVDDLLGRAGAPPIGDLHPTRQIPSASSPDHVSGPGRPTATTPMLTRAHLEGLLNGNHHRQVEVTNGLWEAPSAAASPTRWAATGPIQIGQLDDDTFELRVPRNSVRCFRSPYHLATAWPTSDGKIAIRFEGRPVLRPTGFNLET